MQKQREVLIMRWKRQQYVAKRAERSSGKGGVRSIVQPTHMTHAQG